MGQLYVFCNPPHILIPPSVTPANFMSVPIPDTIPVGRQACVNAFLSYSFGGSVPWQPWNFTNPCIPDSSEVPTAAWGAPKTLTKTMCIPIATTAIQYPEPNSAGTLTTTLHPDSYCPSIGDYLSVVWDDGAHPSEKKGVSGEQVFYGRVTKAQKTQLGIMITAVDAIGVLLDQVQFSVGKRTALQAIFQIGLYAGAYMYLSDNIFTAVVDPPMIPISRVYTGTYLSGVCDLLDRWYLETGHRHYIAAYGGLIEIASYDNFDEVDVIDARKMKKWKFEQNTDHTYTRTYITYPVTVRKTVAGKTSETKETRAYTQAATDLLFRHSRYHTFRYSAESLEEAEAMSMVVLENHSRPEFFLSMDEVEGMTHLRPGMFVAVPVIRDSDQRELVALSRIRSITHNFDPTRYTMDVVADCDPYEVYDPVDTNPWAESLTVTYFDAHIPKPCKYRNEKWVQVKLQQKVEEKKRAVERKKVEEKKKAVERKKVEEKKEVTAPEFVGGTDSSDAFVVTSMTHIKEYYGQVKHPGTTIQLPSAEKIRGVSSIAWERFGKTVSLGRNGRIELLSSPELAGKPEIADAFLPTTTELRVSNRKEGWHGQKVVRPSQKNPNIITGIVTANKGGYLYIQTTENVKFRMPWGTVKMGGSLHTDLRGREFSSNGTTYSMMWNTERDVMDSYSEGV